MKRVILFALFVAFIFSCSDDPIESEKLDLDTSDGVFIACEGNFNVGNGSLSFYDTESRKITNRIFHARNDVPLGDVVNAVALFKNDLYIVANNSGKVVVVDANTIEFKGNITGLSSPRFIHFVSDQKAYISDIMAGEITIFNPQSLEVTGTIDLNGKTVEQMVQIGDYLYATNWSYGRKVLVINTKTDELVSEIEVPLQPKDMAVDKNGKLWVLSDGGYEGSPGGHEEPALCRIDVESQTIEQVYKFELNDFLSGMKMNGTGDTLYYVNHHLYKMHIGSSSLPESEFLASNDELIYSFTVDPESNEIYLVDAIDYTQDALIKRFSQGGELIDSFNAGINPSDFEFR